MPILGRTKVICTVYSNHGMNIHDHNSEEYGKKVWLSRSDVKLLLESAKNSERRIAYSLGVLCGLRTKEILQVAPSDIVNTSAGKMLVIREGKGDKYREVPIPPTLSTTINTVDDYRDGASTDPIVSVNSTRALRKWIERRRTALASEYDNRWGYVSFHDLRRTWASALSDSGVKDRLVMSWGGWEDLETFLEHYEGKYSPEAQTREREKVEWL